MLDRQTLQPTIVDLAAEPDRKDEVLVHRADDASGMLGTMLSNMAWPQFPVPMGIFRQHAAPTYDSMVEEQLPQALAKSGEPDLNKLLFAGDMWEV